MAWDFKINPEVSFQVIRNIEPESKDKDRQKIIIRFDKPLNQNATYTLSISKTPQSYNTNTDEVLIKIPVFEAGASAENPDAIVETFMADHLPSEGALADDGMINSDSPDEAASSEPLF